jgi:hypothetical protein
MAVPATTQPCTLTSAPNTMAVPARMEPSKSTLAPKTAEVRRAHTTFSALAPLIRTILTPAPTAIEIPAWKRNTGLGSFSPSKTTVRPAAIAMLPVCQVPGWKVLPPISIGRAFASSLITIAAPHAFNAEAANRAESPVAASSPSTIS